MKTKTVEEWETILHEGIFITRDVRESIRQVAGLMHEQIKQAMENVEIDRTRLDNVTTSDLLEELRRRYPVNPPSMETASSVNSPDVSASPSSP